MVTVLMVAEKPILAKTIAEILSNGHMKTRKGFNQACSIHEFDGTLFGRSVLFKMTSTCGHVLTLNFTRKYNDWNRVDPAELFQAAVVKEEANAKLRMVQFLASEARGIAYLVLWLDCDKEGENICFEVIDAVRQEAPYLVDNVIYRAHFSSLAPSDIRSAMTKLIRPNRFQSLSVDARQELDLRIGCAFTRFQTRFFHDKYGNLDSNLLSFGPCQTPTLGFCVARHDAIQGFTPEPYWTMNLELYVDKETTVKAVWQRARVFDRPVFNVLMAGVKSAKQAVVKSTSSEVKTKRRPHALNTVEMLRVASAGLGMGPQAAMSTAEHLYTQGYISYPRTETSSYPKHFDFKSILSGLSQLPQFAGYVQGILARGIRPLTGGTDAGDHPPITPMGVNRGMPTGGGEARLYTYIIQHFLSTLMADCSYRSDQVVFTVGRETFLLTSIAVIDPGFTEIMTWKSVSTGSPLPRLKEGDILTIKNVSAEEKHTTPPDYLTESELISLMEKHGIGVTGTARRLVPTKLGILLVHGYKKIDHELVEPTMRAAVEKELNLIAKGEVDFHVVLNHVLRIFRLKFEYFTNEIRLMDALFEDSYTTLAESGKPYTRCGRCKRYMKLVVAGNRNRLHCIDCQETYLLPYAANVSVRPFGENLCPADGFGLLRCIEGQTKRSYIVCPNCYLQPPVQQMSVNSVCSQCIYPNCPYTMLSLGILPCKVCATTGRMRNGLPALMVLDPDSGPKWRISCNSCSYSAAVFQKASNVVVTDKLCSQCSAKILSVVFSAEKSPFPSGESMHVGCLNCDPVFKSMVPMNMPQDRNKIISQAIEDENLHNRGWPAVPSGRGRGGGRGAGNAKRGPRGRGRGRGGRGTRGRGMSREPAAVPPPRTLGSYF